MIVTPIKTQFKILDKYVTRFEECSILVVTSKNCEYL